MLNDFLQYLKNKMLNDLEISENYLHGTLHSINIFFDSNIVMGQFTAWSDLKSTREFIDYETGNQISWHSNFNENIDDLINEFNLFMAESKERIRK